MFWRSRKKELEAKEAEVHKLVESMNEMLGNQIAIMRRLKRLEEHNATEDKLAPHLATASLVAGQLTNAVHALMPLHRQLMGNSAAVAALQAAGALHEAIAAVPRLPEVTRRKP